MEILEKHVSDCAQPCRLANLQRRGDLNHHLVDMREVLSADRVSVFVLSNGQTLSVPSASVVPIPEVHDVRLSRRDAQPAVLRRLLDAALQSALPDDQDVDVSDLIEHILRFLVLPVVDATRVRATGASSCSDYGPCHPRNTLDPSHENWWISESQPETGGRGEWVQYELGPAPVIVDYFHMTIPPLPGGPLSVRTFYLEACTADAPEEAGASAWRRVTDDLMTLDVPGRQWWHLEPQVEARFVRIVCLVNAAAQALGPERAEAARQAGFQRGLPSSIGFFACGFAAKGGA